MSKPVSVAVRLSVAGGVCVVLAACGPRAHCAGEHPYQEAKTVTALQNVDDIKVPSSPSALQIPSIPDNGDYQPYSEVVTEEEGARRITCLDSPPRLPEVVGEEEAASDEDSAG